MNEIYGSQNYQDYMNDSSNHAHDGANGHEGVPEMLQRLAKETRIKDMEDKYRNIARKLLSGELFV